MSGYSQTPGDCYGVGIGGVVGILTATACAHVCDDVAECVGFVFVNLAAHRTKCYLKKGLCAKTAPKDGIKMYTRTKLSKFTIYHLHYHQGVYHSKVGTPHWTVSKDAGLWLVLAKQDTRGSCVSVLFVVFFAALSIIAGSTVSFL